MPGAPESRDQTLETLRLRAVAEQRGERVLELSSDGRFSFVSPNVEFVLGFTAEEFEVLGPLERVQPDDLAGLTATTKRC